MNSVEVVRLRHILEINEEVDESELSDELTSEGPVILNTIRDSVGEENMKNSPLGRSFYKTQNDKLNNKSELSLACTRMKKKCKTTYVKPQSQVVRMNDIDSFVLCKQKNDFSLIKKSSLQMEISSLLKQIIKIKREKVPECDPKPQKNNEHIEEFVSVMNID